MRYRSTTPTIASHFHDSILEQPISLMWLLACLLATLMCSLIFINTNSEIRCNIAIPYTNQTTQMLGIYA